MANNQQQEPEVELFFFRPAVGTLFTVLSGMAFLIVCMVLPLVGKAAVQTDRYPANRLLFTAFLLLAIVLGVLAIVSKVARRHIDNSPPPIFSIALTGLSVVLLGSLLLGLLKI